MECRYGWVTHPTQTLSVEAVVALVACWAVLCVLFVFDF